MTDDERTQILAMLMAGASCREVARITHRAPSTISATARQSGINIRDLTRTRDRKRLDEALERAERVLAALDDPSKAGKVIAALVALIDQRRALDEDNFGTPRTSKKSRGV